MSAKDLAERLGWPRRGFEQRFHAYVSGDPSTNVAGTPFPTVSGPREWPTVPLDSIALAALSATPWSPAAERRRLIVALARNQGWNDARVVARSLAVTPQAMRRMRDGADPAAVRAALLCLGDERLRLPAPWIRSRGNPRPKAPPPWERLTPPRS